MLQFLDSFFPVRYAVLGLCGIGFMLSLFTLLGFGAGGRSDLRTHLRQ